MKNQLIAISCIMFLIAATAMAQAPGGPGRGGRGPGGRGPGGRGGPQGPGGSERLLDDLPLSSLQQGIDARAALIAYDETIRQQTLQARGALLEKMKTILSDEQFIQFKDELSQVPLTPPVPLQPRGVATSDLVDRVMDFDTNQDGRVTKDELPERMADLFEQGDTNHDGALDRQEVQALANRNSVNPPPPPRGGGRGPGRGPGRGGPPPF